MDSKSRAMSARAINRSNSASYVEEFADLCIESEDGVDWQPAIQAAINEAIALNRSWVHLPADGDLYVNNEILIDGQNISIEGNNCTLHPMRDNMVVMRVPKNQNQFQRSEFRNFSIGGNFRPGCVLFQLDNTVHNVLRNIVLYQAGDVALWLNQAQFNQFYDLTVIDNDIGIYVTNGTNEEGGGNSNAFYSPQIISNYIGVLHMLTDAVVLEFGDNHFHSATVLSNKYCSFAFFNTRACYINGACPEYSGFANLGEEITRKGVTIPRCSIYLVGSELILSHVKNNEWVIGDCWRAKENSTLIINDPIGYGGVWVNHVLCDETSQVSLNGSMRALGNFNNVVGAPTYIELYHSLGFVLKNATVVEDRTIENHIKNPRDIWVDIYPGTATQCFYGQDVDPVMGLVKWIQYSPGRTDQNLNRGTFFRDFTFTKGVDKLYFAISFNIKANMDTPIEITFGEPRWNVLKTNLKAGEWKRIVMMAKRVEPQTTLSGDIFIYAAYSASLETVGPVRLYFSHAHTINTDDQSVMAKLAAGHFNDRNEEVFRRDQNGDMWRETLSSSGTPVMTKVEYAEHASGSEH